MTLVIFDNTRAHYHAIPGERVKPSGLGRDGRPERSGWDCPRCGRDVDNHGAHLVKRAPCPDCREVLRDQYGDDTIYDQRRLKKLAAEAKPAPPIIEPPHHVLEAITVRHVSFPLARVGASIDPEL